MQGLSLLTSGIGQRRDGGEMRDCCCRVAALLLSIALVTSARPALAQDAVRFSDEYVYRIWTITGITNTWQSPATCNADALVVAGGGGGGRGHTATTGGGGGGAGGLVSTSVAIEDGVDYTVYVGAGGFGAYVTGQTGRDGKASRFGSAVAYGGGAGGGTNPSKVGRPGGSGGGGGAGTGAGGAATNLQGTAGANGSTYWGGGGGGAGGSAAKTQDGKAGLDLSAWLDGLTLGDNGWFAGGGGSGGWKPDYPGGFGGSGGGGDGTTNFTVYAAQHGIHHSGGGGGGASLNDGVAGSDSEAAGSGGSGIVVLRTAIADEPDFKFRARPLLQLEVPTTALTLEWLAPAQGSPINYVVHLGTTPGGIVEVGRTTGLTLPVTLTLGQTYFLRVDVETASETIEGALVSFDCATPGTKYVSAAGLAIQPYATWRNAATNIRQVATTLRQGETAIVADGVYSHTNRLSITAGATLRSLNGWDAAEIVGQLRLWSKTFAIGFTFRELDCTAFVPVGEIVLSKGTLSDSLFYKNNVRNYSCLYGGTVVRTACVLNYGSASSGGVDARYATLRDCISIGCEPLSNMQTYDNCTVVNGTIIGAESGMFYGGKVAYNTVYSYCRLLGTSNGSFTNYFSGPYGAVPGDGNPQFADAAYYNAAAGSWVAGNTGRNFESIFINSPGYLSGGLEGAIEGLRPLRTSPLKDSGDDQYVTTSTDYTGQRRISGNSVDIGALEFPSPSGTLLLVR